MAIPTAANTGVPTAKPGANRPGLIVATGIHANGEAGTGAMPAASAVTPRQVRDEVNTGGTVNRADMIAIAAVPAIMTVGTSPATATATAGVPAGTIIAATGTTGTGAGIIAMPAATGMAAIRVGTITAVITATPAGTAMAATRPGIAATNAGTIMTIAAIAGGAMTAGVTPAPITTAAAGNMPSAAAISIATGPAVRRACTGCIT